MYILGHFLQTRRAITLIRLVTSLSATHNIENKRILFSPFSFKFSKVSQTGFDSVLFSSYQVEKYIQPPKPSFLESVNREKSKALLLCKEYLYPSLQRRQKHINYPRFRCATKEGQSNRATYEALKFVLYRQSGQKKIAKCL